MAVGSSQMGRVHMGRSPGCSYWDTFKGITWHVTTKIWIETILILPIRVEGRRFGRLRGRIRGIAPAQRASEGMF